MKKDGKISSLTGILIAVLAAIIAGGGVWSYYNFKVLPEIEEGIQTSQPVMTAPRLEDEAKSEEKDLTLKKAICQDLFPGSGYGPCPVSSEESIITEKTYCEVAKVSGDYAFGSAENATWIAKKMDNKWTQLGPSVQDVRSCDFLSRNNIPKDVLENEWGSYTTCLNRETGEEEEYQEGKDYKVPEGEEPSEF